MTQNGRVLFAMGSSPEETRPAAPPIASPDRKKGERWERYFYALHLAVQESERLDKALTLPYDKP